MARITTNPYVKDLGFVSARKSPITTGWVVLYDGRIAGFDLKKGRWHLYCPDHGSMFAETNKARATKLMGNPAGWCGVCKKHHDDKHRPMKPMILNDSQEAKDREMALWAKRAKNNPEKCRLFEQMYGVKPDRFWD